MFLFVSPISACASGGQGHGVSFTTVPVLNSYSSARCTDALCVTDKLVMHDSYAKTIQNIIYSSYTYTENIFTTTKYLSASKYLNTNVPKESRFIENYNN